MPYKIGTDERIYLILYIIGVGRISRKGRKMQQLSNSSLVSVIMPVYNVEKYIERSLESVCNQNYEKLEIILVDDGCKDKSIEVAMKVLKKTGRRYKIVHQKNSGLPAARNSGIKASSGKYVCFIDSDDCIQYDHVSILYNLAKQDNLAVVHSGFETISEKRKAYYERENVRQTIDSHEQAIKNFMLRRPAVHCCTLLIERNFLLMNRLWFNEKLRYGEDVEFMSRLFAINVYVGNAHVRSYKYLIREHSIMRSITLEQGKVFINEFSKTIKGLKTNKSDVFQIDGIYIRTLVGFFHVFAAKGTYEDFQFLLGFCDDNLNNRYIKQFPDFRVRILAYILYYCPCLFYIIFHRGNK